MVTGAGHGSPAGTIAPFGHCVITGAGVGISEGCWVGATVTTGTVVFACIGGGSGAGLEGAAVGGGAGLGAAGVGGGAAGAGTGGVPVRSAGLTETLWGCGHASISS